jgi:catechol 2,3-dioxygenase-like lactoylglutathione lyase family enzyme
MSILGIDHLLFGVDDVTRCAEWLMSFGLGEVATDRHGRRFASADGSAIVLRDSDVSHLPPASTPGAAFRAARFAVADRYALAAIGQELARDRYVEYGPDGSFQTMDDAGFCIAFQCEPDAVVFRGDAKKGPARSLIQVAYRVPDVERASRFYIERLGFLADCAHLLRAPAGSMTVLLLQGAPGHPCLERVAFAPRESCAGDVHGPLQCAMGWGAETVARASCGDVIGRVAHPVFRHRQGGGLCPVHTNISYARSSRAQHPSARP